MKLDTDTLRDFSQVRDTLDVSDGVLRHAYLYQKVVEPIKVGRSTLFTLSQIETLRKHFLRRNPFDVKNATMNLAEFPKGKK